MSPRDRPTHSHSRRHENYEGSHEQRYSSFSYPDDSRYVRVCIFSDLSIRNQTNTTRLRTNTTRLTTALLLVVTRALIAPRSLPLRLHPKLLRVSSMMDPITGMPFLGHGPPRTRNHNKALVINPPMVHTLLCPRTSIILKAVHRAKNILIRTAVHDNLALIRPIPLEDSCFLTFKVSTTAVSRPITRIYG